MPAHARHHQVQQHDLRRRRRTSSRPSSGSLAGEDLETLLGQRLGDQFQAGGIVVDGQQRDTGSAAVRSWEHSMISARHEAPDFGQQGGGIDGLGDVGVEAGVRAPVRGRRAWRRRSAPPPAAAPAGRRGGGRPEHREAVQQGHLDIQQHQVRRGGRRSSPAPPRRRHASRTRSARASSTSAHQLAADRVVVRHQDGRPASSRRPLPADGRVRISAPGPPPERQREDRSGCPGPARLSTRICPPCIPPAGA